MINETAIVLRGEKNANIIQALCELFNLSLLTATDIFYSSETSSLIEDKVSDLHCRSDRYLATLVMDEYKEKLGKLGKLTATIS